MKNENKQPEITMKAIKKPIPVEFIKLKNTPMSIISTYRFIHGEKSVELTSPMAHDYWDNYSDKCIKQGYMPLKTLESGEGTQNANIGDYILKGIDGECWPVKPDIFQRTYDIQPTPSPESKEVETIEQAAEQYIIKEGFTDDLDKDLITDAFIAGHKTHPIEVYTRSQMIEFGEKVREECLKGVWYKEGLDYENIQSINIENLLKQEGKK